MRRLEFEQVYLVWSEHPPFRTSPSGSVISMMHDFGFSPLALAATWN